uniref:(northern house mosquito) hypothetical protein n=1 Tax=Culex pipiens TaxID=7175 RepID=A0A8D8BHM5_CULPI
MTLHVVATLVRRGHLLEVHDLVRPLVLVVVVATAMSPQAVRTAVEQARVVRAATATSPALAGAVMGRGPSGGNRRQRAVHDEDVVVASMMHGARLVRVCLRDFVAHLGVAGLVDLDRVIVGVVHVGVVVLHRQCVRVDQLVRRGQILPAAEPRPQARVGTPRTARAVGRVLGRLVVKVEPGRVLGAARVEAQRPDAILVGADSFTPQKHNHYDGTDDGRRKRDHDQRERPAELLGVNSAIQRQRALVLPGPAAQIARGQPVGRDRFLQKRWPRRWRHKLPVPVPERVNRIDDLHVVLDQWWGQVQLEVPRGWHGSGCHRFGASGRLQVAGGMGRLVVVVVVLDGCGGGDGPGAIGAVARTATAAAAVATVTVTGRRGQGQAEVIFGGGQLGQREHRSSGAGIVDWWEVQTNRDDDGLDEVP